MFPGRKERPTSNVQHRTFEKKDVCDGFSVERWTLDVERSSLAFQPGLGLMAGLLATISILAPI
jgi:hypothetical protein